MINQLLVIPISILSYEFIKYFKLIKIINETIILYKKILKLVISKKISDFRKEKLLKLYSKLLFIFSIKILSIVGIICLFIFFGLIFSSSFINYLFSFYGILQITVIIFFYYLIKRKYE